MKKDKKKDIRVERLSGFYKRIVVKDLMSHMVNYYPELSRTQIRRIFNYAYQGLRKGRER